MMSRKVYIELAKILRGHRNCPMIKELLVRITVWLSEDNPRFDACRFYDAVYEEAKE